MPETNYQRRILIIDDDANLRDILVVSLEEEGYETVSAENGAAAIAILEREAFDVVLVDLVMPKMDGLRFLRWLRGEHKSRVPTLVFTGSLDVRGELEKDALSAGADGVLLKPVDFPVLLAALARFFEAGAPGGR
ncbi:MAG: response regulator [Planctomycetes bacterium]|nr:response regulator [Planctomycetota bacterium]